MRSVTGSSPSAVTRIASPPSAANVTAAFAAGPPAATNWAVDVIFSLTAGAFAMRWITSSVANPTKTPTGAFSETGAFLIGGLLCTGHERHHFGHRTRLRIDDAGALP